MAASVRARTAARSSSPAHPVAPAPRRPRAPRSTSPAVVECRDSEAVSCLFAERFLSLRDQSVVDRAMAILERRMASRDTVFCSPSAVGQYACLQIGSLPHEVFCVMFLDSQHRLIAFEQMFRGTLNQTSVYPREVLSQALMHGAAAVILAHNHPSGALEPSRADEQLTMTLRNALAMVDVRVLDHVIVSGNRSLSMAAQGLV